VSNRETFNTQFFRHKLCILASALLLTNSSLTLAQDASAQTSPRKTTVYKVINPDGSISFSDKAIRNSVKMEVAPIPTVPAYKPINNTNLPETTNNSKNNYYSSLVITNPSHGSAFHSGSGDINISTKIAPALRTTDLIRFSLDGTVIKTQKASTLQLKQVDRGTHTVMVEIITAENKSILSASTQFTLHRPIARSR
jgi:hypothetical protein